MKKLLYIILILPLSLFAQNTYYMATDGSDDTGDGSINNEWATLQKAIDEARPGDTVYIRGGTYMSAGRTRIDAQGRYNYQYTGDFLGFSGKRDSIIHYWGYPGERPIFNCIGHGEFVDGSNVYNSFLQINDVEYVSFKNFEVHNVLQLDSTVTAAINARYSANLRFENLRLENIGQRGFDMISDIDDNEDTYTHDTTYFINIDVYNICDTFSVQPGNAADGFITGNYGDSSVYYWDGCRIWDYTDDGINAYGRGKKVISNCWFMGTDKWGTGDSGFDVEQNGVKLGGINYRHWDAINNECCLGFDSHENKPYGIIYNNLAIFNVGGGFLTNVQAQAIDMHNVLYNNTAYKAERGFSDTYYYYGVPEEQEAESPFGWWRNNISYKSTSITAGEPRAFEVYIRAATQLGYPYNESNNTWDMSTSYPGFVPASDVTITDDDFVTTDSVTLRTLFLADRQEDGSLPSTFPLRLAPDSDLINAGIQIPESDSAYITIDYYGTAPDIGAFQYDASPPASIRRPKAGRSAGGTSVLNGKVLIF